MLTCPAFGEEAPSLRVVGKEVRGKWARYRLVFSNSLSRTIQYTSYVRSFGVADDVRVADVKEFRTYRSGQLQPETGIVLSHISPAPAKEVMDLPPGQAVDAYFSAPHGMTWSAGVRYRMKEHPSPPAWRPQFENSFPFDEIAWSPPLDGSDIVQTTDQPMPSGSLTNRLRGAESTGQQGGKVESMR